MGNSLFIGFKGKNNASAVLAEALSPCCCLLTNSFSGLEKDIEGIKEGCDAVYLFGIDKNLKDSLRVETAAEKEGTRLETCLDTDALRKHLEAAGIRTGSSGTPTHYLCNEAYWRLLRRFSGRAVLIHIPALRHFDEAWIPLIRQAVCR